MSDFTLTPQTRGEASPPKASRPTLKQIEKLVALLRNRLETLEAAHSPPLTTPSPGHTETARLAHLFDELAARQLVDHALLAALVDEGGGGGGLGRSFQQHFAASKAKVTLSVAAAATASNLASAVAVKLERAAKNKGRGLKSNG